MFLAVALFGSRRSSSACRTSLALSLAGLFVLGAADMVSVVIRQTLVQLETPDAMRGRVAAVNAVSSAPRTSSASSNPACSPPPIGTVPAVVLGGVGTLVVAALWARWFPALRSATSSSKARRPSAGSRATAALRDAGASQSTAGSSAMP